MSKGSDCSWNAGNPDTPGSTETWEHYVERTTQPAVAEVIIVDPLTGGRKARKLARTDLLPVDALLVIAEHYGRGAEKYEDRNWEKGYAWSLSYGALLRHLFAFWNGEDIDAETGSTHLAAVGWHALALIAFTTRDIGTDDRP